MIARFKEKFGRPLDAVFTCVILALALGHTRHYFTGRILPTDFTAFYCGGTVSLAGADPYLLEPLLTCERRNTEDGALLAIRPFPPYGTPVPLPPYDFGFLRVLALMPMLVGKALYGLLELGSMLVLAYGIRKLSKFPFSVALGIAYFGVGFQAQVLGQFAPVAIAAIALAAISLREGRMVAGGVLVSLSLIQPQFAAPGLVSAFLFYPRARVVIAVSCAALVALALSAGGIHRILEYATLLPIHARAEIAFAPQYSLAFVLHALGVPTALALTAGSIQYVAFALISIAIVAYARPNSVSSGAAVLLPPAFAVFGGTFIHLYQVFVALLIAVTIPFTRRTAPAIALALTWLILPWQGLGIVRLSTTVWISTVAGLIVVGLAAYLFLSRTYRARTAALAAVACVAISIGTYVSLRYGLRDMDAQEAKTPIHVAAPLLPPESLGSIGWGDGIVIENASKPPSSTRYYKWLNWYLKIPTWIAIAIVIGASSYVLVTERRRAEPNALTA